MNRFSEDLRRLQETVTDAARIGKRELLRSMDGAKKQLTRMQFLQRRKDLMAELGRHIYDSYRDGFPENIKPFFEETELKDILHEITDLDVELEKRLKGEA